MSAEGMKSNGVLMGCRNHSDQSPKLKVSRVSDDFIFSFFTGAIKNLRGLARSDGWVQISLSRSVPQVTFNL